MRSRRVRWLARQGRDIRIAYNRSISVIEPIRIVHIVPTVENGGAEQQLLALTQAQDRSCWEPQIICTHALGTLGPEFESAGVPVQVLGKGDRFGLSLPRRLAGAIAELKPHIVHTWLTSANFWGRVASLLLPERPVVIASERTIDEWQPKWSHTLDLALSRVSDAVVGNSAQVSDFLVNVKRLPREKVYTIRNGTNLERVQRCLLWTREERRAYRAELGLPSDAFVVGNIGQPIREKRFDVLTEVIGNLYRRGVNVRLLQLGPDPRSPSEDAYFAEYRRWIRQQGIEDCLLRRGFVRDISPELAVMDALVHTSDIEGFPNAVIEAQAMALPVVATAAGGTPDAVVHRSTGWLVPTGDVDGLTEGLMWVHANPYAARLLGEAARERVEARFTVDALVRNTTALYARLLRSRGVPVPDVSE